MKKATNPKVNKQLLHAVSLLGQLGLIMAVSVLLFVILGYYIDRWLGWSGIAIGICSFLGIICGGAVDWKLLMKYFDKTE